MNRRWVRGVSVSIGLGLSGAGPVVAQTADLARATCAQLNTLSRSDRLQLVIWLHGYYAGAAQRTTIDRAGLEQVVEAVQAACERDETLPLIGATLRALALGTASAAPQAPPPASPTPTVPDAPLRPTPIR